MTELIQVIAKLSAGDVTHWAAVVYEASPRDDGQFDLIKKGMQIMHEVGKLEAKACMPVPDPLLQKHFHINDVIWRLGMEEGKYAPILTTKGTRKLGQYLSDHRAELFAEFAYQNN